MQSIFYGAINVKINVKFSQKGVKPLIQDMFQILELENECIINELMDIDGLSTAGDRFI